jgi:uncharacterized repeat protein (TIGR02543 family)
MAKLTNTGIRYMVGILSIAVSAVVVGSIIASSMYALADAIRESNVTSSASSSSSSVSSSSSISSSSSTSTSVSSSSTVVSSQPISSEPIIIPEYTVEFNAMGGAPSLLAPVVVKEGNTIPQFPAVSLVNNTFLGWYTGITPNDVLFTATMPVVRDMVLFAWWQVNPAPVTPPPGAVTHIVAFNAQGGTPIDSIQVETGKTISLPTSVRSGYVFLGWFTGELPGDVLFTAQTPVTRDLVLFARWERQSFMISFITDGGTSVAPIIAKADDVIEPPVPPVKQNFSFGGWYLENTFINEYIFTTMPEMSFTLYAQWNIGTSEGLLYACGAGECIITGYEGIHTEITIPRMINDLPVTTISDYAFEANRTIMSIVFPNDSLVTTIGRGAFMDTPLLRQVVLSSSLRTIRAEAFKNATSLLSLSIPLEVSALGRDLLVGADSLRQVTVSFANNRSEVSAFNFKYLFGGTAFDSVVNIPGSLETIIITQGTVSLPQNGLRNLPLVKEVIIPNTITSIGTDVLTGATNLESLTWTFTSGTDTAVNSYLSYAFGNAHGAVTQVPGNLKHVTIQETAITRIASRAFYNIPSLETIQLPNNILDMGNEALAHVASTTSKLQYIDLPSGLLTLGNSVFANSGALLDLVIPQSVTSIGTNLLGGTTNLASLSVSYQSLNLKFLRYLYGGTSATAGGTAPLANLKTVEITGTTNTIATDFFRSNNFIETLYLPETVTALGNSVFFGMAALKQVQVTGALVESNKVILPSLITSIGTNLFDGASSVIDVTIPQGITVIPTNTFAGTTALRTVRLPDALTDIQLNAFLNSGIETISLPNTLTTLGATVFSGSGLMHLTIPNSVTTIGTSLLLNTTKLESLSFSVDSMPTTLRFLRYFYGGTAFNTGGTPPTALSVLKTITITGGSLLNANFFNGVLAPIETVTLPSTLTAIGDLAFANFASIRTVTISEGLLTLGVSSFFNTPLLAILDLPLSLTTVGASAFQQSGIGYLRFGENLASIGNNAFVASTNLTLIEFYGVNPPAVFGTTVFATTAGGAVLLPNLVLQIPFGSTAAYTNTAINPNYVQFLNVFNAGRLTEAEGEDLDVVLP